ncbi:helix-turn-helix transcriptional regulator [Christensenellaceae bacterium NSJ-63]|uniref:Helix-turn-helix transcriptional regulator n=1 Tax=Guopingia tenuis TaxID=2763656 RepID=A0A926HT39_9FIRM|nr:helix-turn-helix transcriptional regulator [Guopingia tenuis]MBC8539102.1 helix-turn-helix transcriptional regulator [Guopingia tenuis]
MPEIRDIIITTKVNYGSIIVNIKDLMDSKGISRSRLARMTGIRYSMINRYYKNGDALQRIDLDVFSRICYALDCPLDSIMKYCPPDADDPETAPLSVIVSV